MFIIISHPGGGREVGGSDGVETRGSGYTA